MAIQNSDNIPDSAKLAAIVESSGDAIISKDLDGIITSWNAGAEAIFGYTADEAVGRSVTMLIPPERHDEEPSILSKIRRGEKIDHYETIRLTKGGRRIDISLNVSPVYDNAGNVIGASKIARDVTERKNVDAEVAKFAEIVASSSDAIISKDLDGIITSWNKGAEEIFGYTESEVVGKPVTILMPEDRVDEEPGILERIRRGESIDHYETIRRRKDGTLLDISLSVSPIRDAHGEIVGASKIARDVTQTKSSIAELTTLASIVQSSSDAIVSKDLNGIIRSWNSGAEAIFGYTAAEAIGQPVTMLMPPDRLDEEPGIIERIRRGEAVSHYVTVRRRKDGSLVDISLNVSPVYDSHGQIVGASKIARDITEHNRVESAVRESEMMRRLVQAQESERRRIARDLHDHIGQQMTGIRLKIERLLELIEGDGPAMAELVSIRDLALRMDRDIGFLSWELRPVELDNLGLENALRSFVHQWSAQYDIAAVFESEKRSTDAKPLPPDVETGLYRILQESLNNVFKHAEATEVTVFFHHRQRDVSLIVEDNGNGFNDGEPHSGGSGHGLGLTGMRERAELLRGTLEIESEPGRTSIIVHIPVK